MPDVTPAPLSATCLLPATIGSLANKEPTFGTNSSLPSWLGMATINVPLPAAVRAPDVLDLTSPGQTSIGKPRAVCDCDAHLRQLTSASHNNRLGEMQLDVLLRSTYNLIYCSTVLHTPWSGATIKLSMRISTSQHLDADPHSPMFRNHAASPAPFPPMLPYSASSIAAGPTTNSRAAHNHVWLATPNSSIWSHQS
jgi:hypothetical protein